MEEYYHAQQGGLGRGAMKLFRSCPDGGRCHHSCRDDVVCWRVYHAAPLSEYADDWNTTQGKTVIDVVAAVRRDREGRVWCAKRSSDGEHAGLAGLWEYPGGKVEPGEQLREALVRELQEEFPGVEPKVGRVLDSIEATLRGTGVKDPALLDRVYRVTFFEVDMGEPRELACHTEARWMTPEEACAVEHLPSGTIFNARHLATKDDNPSAAALDDIVLILGAPDWDYPGQVVRDVAKAVGMTYKEMGDLLKKKGRPAEIIRDPGYDKGYSDGLGDAICKCGAVLGECCRHAAQARREALALDKLYRSAEGDAHELLEDAERMHAALKAIMHDPQGCVFCDSGTLRNPDKPHRDDCGFRLAALALGTDGEKKNDGE